eukprot:scaffold2226_cov166-Pinguiococcus_pyrenoidosus.AAC.3
MLALAIWTSSGAVRSPYCRPPGPLAAPDCVRDAFDCSRCADPVKATASRSPLAYVTKSSNCARAR